jgi:hypothetical protein
MTVKAIGWRATVRKRADCLRDPVRAVNMQRRTACQDQVRICLERAKYDTPRRDYWHAEAIRWQHRADEEIGDQPKSYAIVKGRLVPTTMPA